MNKKNLSKLFLLITACATILVGCGGSGNESDIGSDTETAQTEQAETEATESTETSEETEVATEDSQETENASSDQGGDTIIVRDATGEVEVPLNPETVVALDNRTFETLDDWGIEVAAAPKGLVPSDLSYANDDSVADIGNHREPDLEVIAAVDPDLVIIGQRFASHEEAIREIVPDAAVIDLNIDVSETAENPRENLVNGLKSINMTLGQIFEKEDEAEELITEFDEAIAGVNESYNPDETVMSVVVSGGEIGFSAPGNGRVWGPLYEVFGWAPALNVDESSSDHKGDDISVEAIAESNPDWLMVLDRDAGASQDEETVPAQDVIEGAPALQETTSVSQGNIVYAPADTYINESMQTYIELFADLAAAFEGGSAE